jgi:uncharacterized protein YceH (UPF0502 family)
VRLSADAARVLGSLVEKALTTPQQYPLTIASLTAACNQATNRDPVVDYDEHTVMSTLDGLKEQRLVRFVLPSSGRTAVRYRHILNETWALDTPQCALVAVLLLRGAQTIGELRLRTSRMVEFSGLDQVQRELELLASHTETLASELGRRPGQKEERWACPLVAPGPDGPELDAPGPDGPRECAASVVGPSVESGAERWDERHERHELEDTDLSPEHGLDDLRSELSLLRAEVSELRHELEDLRTSLGG